MGKKKLIHFNVQQFAALHCDNPRCGHDLPVGGVPWGPWLIGTACPKCGSDMLIKKDFLLVEQFIRYANWLNKWFGWLGRADPADKRNVTRTIKIGNGR